MIRSTPFAVKLTAPRLPCRCLPVHPASADGKFLFSSNSARAARRGVAQITALKPTSMNVTKLPMEWLGGCLIFFVTFVGLRASPIHQVADSKYSMLLSERLLWHRTFSFDRAAIPWIPPQTPGEVLIQGKNVPYQLEYVRGRFYYWFPPGTSILSVPYVALMNAVGISTVDRNGVFSEEGETRIQADLAALLMAAVAALTFCTARLFLPRGWSCLIALGTAFGTQIWSTASRALWGDTWGVFVSAIVLWLLVRADTKQLRPRPVLLATCLSWLYFTRPTFCVLIVAVAGYMLVYHRSIVVPFAVTGGLWLAAFIAYSKHHFGTLLPSYYAPGRISLKTFWQGMAGTLFSPSRGLFIYVPVLLFVAYLLVRYRSSWRMPRLVTLALGIVIIYFIMIFSFPGWYAGQCYGARYTTGLVPWFALLGILAVDARLRWREANPQRDSTLRWRTEWCTGVVLLFCSIAINGVGGISPHSIWWNGMPANVDQHQERVWDWKDPQFLRPLQPAKSFAPQR